MSIIWILIIVLLVLAVAGSPGFGYTSGWHASGGLGLVVVVLLILVLLGKV